jgi:very-short-patch-repair endonuclease
MNNNYYNNNLQPFANNLRKAMTKAEACLWKYALKSRNIKGYGFRRQRPVLNYIADFMCPELGLIIEVDGYSHSIDDIIENDYKKQYELESAGYYVLRFSDDEVLKDMINVIKRIEAVVENLEKAKASNPPPTPASGGHSDA